MHLDPDDRRRRGAADARRGRGDRRRRRRVDAARLRRASRSTRSCAGSCRCSSGSRACPSRSTRRRPRSRAARSRLGAELVNDVTALRGDPELAGVVAERGALSLPDAHAGRAAHDAGRSALRRRRRRRWPRSSRSGSAFAVAAGIPEERICLDPGIGFGKTVGAELRARPAARRPAGARPPGADRASRARARSARARRSGGDAPGRSAASLGAAVAAYERGALDPPRPRRARARRGADRGRGR